MPDSGTNGRKPLVFVTQKWSPNRGTSRHLLAIATRLRDRGHDVRVLVGSGSSWRNLVELSPFKTKRLGEEEVCTEVPVYRLAFSWKTFLWVRLLMPITWLWRFVHRSSYLDAISAIVVRGYRKPLSQAIPDDAAVLLFNAVWPYLPLAVMRAFPDRAMLFPLLHTMEEWTRSHEAKELLESSSHVLVSTEHERAWVREHVPSEYGKRPVWVAGLGLFDSDVADEPDPAAFRTKHGIPSDAPIVLFVGTMRKQRFEKGWRELLEAMPSVWERAPEARVVLLGEPDGEAAGLLAGMNDDRVIAPGFVSDEEKENAFAAATCVAYPSRSESFGGVVLEAWKHGKPVVASDIEVFKEIVGAVEGGTCVVPEPEPIAGAVAAYLSSSELAKKDGERGREALRIRFTWDKAIEATTHAIEGRVDADWPDSVLS